MSVPFNGTQRAAPGDGADVSARKLSLRDQLVTARNRRRPAELQEEGAELAARALALPEVRRAASVAAYVSVGTEPGTGAIVDGLHAAGKRVILPLTVRRDYGLDLDWAAYDGPGSLATARYGLLEPTTRPLGLDAIATPDVVLVPGMAVSVDGYRIGKGAGCYDRALGRVPRGTPTVVLLYDDEIGRDVPHEPHDLPVRAALSPRRLVRFA